ncbi:hybrid sensor histidine kinase/response regulator [Algoriphagus marincola]|uniref:hybrid sensor histidine kinase/response regulator n=1 Tax=Algoriphagus marincola TaxID=264027 RepID=UPI00047E691B|nr:response regulator [Algoriphagus marincola]
MKKTILLVEDELELQQNYKEILEFHNFIVHTADNGIDGLDILAKYKFDLIISDILMPKMDGISLLRNIKSKKNYLNIPFIFLTAKIHKEDIRSGMNSGADDYLTKPVSGQMLLNSVYNNIRKQEIRERWLNEKLEKALADSRKITFHEFRTPIYGLLSVFELMQESLEKFEKKEFFELIELGKLSANRINQSLEKLSMYYKLDELKTNPKKIILQNIIQETTNLFKDYEFDVKSEESETPIFFDPYLIRFLILEILENAIKFSSPISPITINIEKTLEVKNHQTISKESGIVKPFPFNQNKRSKNEQQGFGLGLFLVQEICKLNNADFRAHIDESGNFLVNISFKS